MRLIIVGQRRREKIKNLEKKVQLIAQPSPIVTTELDSESPSSSDPQSLDTVWTEIFEIDTPKTPQSQNAVLVDCISNSELANINVLLNDNEFFDVGYQVLTRKETSSTYDNPTPLTSRSSLSLSDELQTLETSQFTFSDTANLPVPELAVMHAGTNIATLLGIASKMWDLTNLHTFSRSSISAPYIPQNLEPTEAQRLIPHHHIFDIIPWPSVRTRIICVFAQPVHTRPASARDPDALMKLFYDMDDACEGMRITGEDWADGENWEIGEVVYRHWWWCFDRKIVDRSNALRRQRGLGRLTMGEERQS